MPEPYYFRGLYFHSCRTSSSKLNFQIGTPLPTLEILCWLTNSACSSNLPLSPRSEHPPPLPCDIGHQEHQMEAKPLQGAKLGLCMAGGPELLPHRNVHWAQDSCAGVPARSALMKPLQNTTSCMVALVATSEHMSARNHSPKR